MRKIRLANFEDIETVHNLLDCKPFKYNDTEVPYDRSWIELLIQNERCLTLVYEINNKIVGFISGEQLVGNFMMLWFCSVQKEYQNGFVGYRLYEEFEKRSKDRGNDGILVYAYKTSEKMLARGGYSSNGNMYKEMYKEI